MNNVIAIHQPNYLPWLGYFYKIYLADTFVFLDDVQFSKGSFANRNKIKTIANKELLLTVPVVHPKNMFPNYNEIQIDYRINWQKKHLNTISQNYSKSINYQSVFPLIQELIEQKYHSLAQLNFALIRLFLQILKIETKLYCSSEIQKEIGTQTDRLLNICKNFGAEVYLSGKGGLNYQDENLFSDKGIRLIYSNYIPFKYNNLNGDFIPTLSVLDVLFNCEIDDVINYFIELKNSLIKSQTKT